MKKIAWSLLWNWMTQERDASLRWVKMKGANERELEAYQAGFEQGWGKLRATLSLHGYLSLDERR